MDGIKNVGTVAKSENAVITQPMVTITADEYFYLRSRAEANNYVMRLIEEFRTESINMNTEMFRLADKLTALEDEIHKFRPFS